MNEFMTPLLLETPISKLNSLKEYEKFLSQFRKISARQIKPGYFYAMSPYEFSKDYPEEIVKYFDEYPLIVCLSLRDKERFYGCNFHFLPVLTRSWFMNRIKGMNRRAFQVPGKTKLNVNYLTIQSLLRKSKYAVRMYRFDRVKEVRLIPNHMISEAVKFAPPTYYKVDIDAVMKRYRSYPTPESDQMELKLKKPNPEKKTQEKSEDEE